MTPTALEIGMCESGEICSALATTYVLDPDGITFAFCDCHASRALARNGWIAWTEAV